MTNLSHGDENAPWEGIGTGWFNSVLGGGYSVVGSGYDIRPYQVNGERKSKTQLGNFEEYLKNNRVSVFEDNTYTNSTNPAIGTRMRGDYAVPTLFNGDFDASSYPNGQQTIPGWSFYNDGTSISQARLLNTSSITAEPDYALELRAGQSITHNRFVVPEWGVLRFDLYVPNPDPATAAQNSVVRVFLDNQELYSSAFQGLSPKDRQSNGNPNTSASEYPAVDLCEFNPNSATPAGLNPKLAEAQSNRIGFANQELQTFQVDIPKEFRDKVATLKFEVSGGKTVYLDNVFFKNQHLLFGNLALNGQEARKDVNTPDFSDPYFIRDD